jgi:hypothetical protein
LYNFTVINGVSEVMLCQIAGSVYALFVRAGEVKKKEAGI